ncbi:hypothetical protein ACIREE_15140 [Streptomyces sp. NPDC102467]|uniref:hypothetical protein n=1 Tax=Streptomyces sp. NPDC102467 TaxID=3366179 RepID=UPI00381D13D7
MTAHPSLATDILTAAAAVTTDGPAAAGGGWVRHYTPPGPDDGSQFLLMLKPELLAEASTDASDGGGLLGRVLDRLAAGGLHLGAVRVVGAAELTARRVVEHHYAVLNRVSTQGLDALPPNARHRLAERYTHTTEHSDTVPTRILGGHQLLAQRPDLTPTALDAFARNLPVAKAAAGVYTTELLLDGERLVVLNAFHPMQLAHFQQPGGAVALLTCTTHRPTDLVRREVIGATDPAQAQPGSVKHMLYQDRATFTEWKVCTRLNGVHLSPGPVEAMFTIQRYFTDDWTPMPLARTALGRRLLAAGADERALSALGDNPVVEYGGGGHLFDVTEDLTTQECEHMLLRLLERPPAARPYADQETTA